MKKSANVHFILVMLLLAAGFATYFLDAPIGLAIIIGAFMGLLVAVGTDLHPIIGTAIDLVIAAIALIVLAGAQKNLQNFLMSTDFLIALFLNLTIFLMEYVVAYLSTKRNSAALKITA